MSASKTINNQSNNNHSNLDSNLFSNFSIFKNKFFLFFVIANIAFRIFRLLGKWDIPEGWPISEGKFLLPTLDGISFLALSILSLQLFFKFKAKILNIFPLILLFSSLLLVFTNGMHGTTNGFIRPLISEDTPEEYYQDIKHVRSPDSFLRDYTTIQPNLLVHSRSHPPGPILIMKVADGLFKKPEVISIFLGIASLLMAGIGFRGYLKNKQFTTLETNYITLLFLCCTAVQVYTLFSIDGLILGISCIFLFTITSEKLWLRMLGFIVCLWSLLLLSFGSLFFLPATFFLYHQNRRYIEFCLGSLVVALALLALNSIYGFSWLHSFKVASSLENSQGYLLLKDPVTFVATRLENIFEIILFTGPLIMFGIFKTSKEHNLRRTFSTILKKPFTETKFMVWSAVILLSVFATGAYHTGETARACLFITPYLFIGASEFLKKTLTEENDLNHTLKWVLWYTFSHQALMNYVW